MELRCTKIDNKLKEAQTLLNELKETAIQKRYVVKTLSYEEYLVIGIDEAKQTVVMKNKYTPGTFELAFDQFIENTSEVL